MNIGIGIGSGAGFYITTGSDNVMIGTVGGMDDATVRIGTAGVQTRAFLSGIYGATSTNGAAVYVNSSGQLATGTSSARFKDNVENMSAASDALYALRPVSFRYKPELDPQGIGQFGLIAEEVEKINPDLVVHDPDGKPYSVRYEQVNAMLLNEFLKEHSRVQTQEAAAKQQQAAIDWLEKALAEEREARETQGKLLQKIAAQMEAATAAPSLADNQGQ